MHKYGLIKLMVDSNHSLGYRFDGANNYETEAEAREAFHERCWNCDRVDLIEYGKGLIETYCINKVLA